MIELKNVSIKYVNDYFSLLNFNSKINNHTIFVGDHYVGSLAIMRILAKIDKHYTGEVFVDNVNLKQIKDKELNIAYVPQITCLFKNKNLFVKY